MCHWKKHDVLVASYVHVFEPLSNKFGADKEIMVGLLICGEVSVEVYVKRWELSKTRSNVNLVLETRRRKTLGVDLVFLAL